jgi:opacity protein-like surface antigen
MRLFLKLLRNMLPLPVCALALMSPAQAADRGFYLGADVVSLQTTLDYGFTETYNTSHARLKVGYQILKFFSVEGRIMSSAYDTDIDLFGGQYRFDTGTMVGVYARPHTSFRNANVYGIVGFTSMNTKYRLVAPVTGPADSNSVLAFTVGVGGSFRIVGNLTLDVEATLYSGTADYNIYFPDSVDLYSVGLGAGLRYRF